MTRLDAIVRDLRFAARGLRRTPVFTFVATLSLALGLALTTSTVSVVNAYLIRSLPYPEADRLHHVRYAPPGPWEPHGMTGLDWKSVEDVVEFAIASSGESFHVTDSGYARSLRGLRVTRGFVDGLGVSVTTGRRFTEQDFVAGSEPVALIGHSLWRDRFGSDPGAIGRLIRGEAESRPGRPETFRIVGVLSPGFYYGRDSRTSVDLLLPHTSPVRTYMVRLRDGIPPAAAQRRLTEAARRAATSPIPADWTGVQLESAHERWVGSLRPVLLGVTVAVSLVVVIVCANVAVLMLLRSMQRQKEVAVRLALARDGGTSRGCFWRKPPLSAPLRWEQRRIRTRRITNIPAGRRPAPRGGNGGGPDRRRHTVTGAAPCCATRSLACRASTYRRTLSHALCCWPLVSRRSSGPLGGQQSLIQ